VVVAIADALVSEGADIGVKLTPLKDGVSPLPPPQAVSGASAARLPAIGSMGAPESILSRWRREN
jgi:hypothetical protein